MPLAESSDFGAKLFRGATDLSIHNHLFPSANTGIAWLRGGEETLKAHQEFLKGVMRVDLFGIRKDGEIDGELIAPLRPEVPALEAGKTYLLETAIRTLKMGHPFTQGTADSNEVWLDITVTSGGRVIGRSGALDPERGNAVDPWSHFVNVFMLDKDGNRISRRNPQDIFTPLYNHQIPPGAAQTVHYELRLPEGLREPVTVEIKLQYRKFDQQYMDFVARKNHEIIENYNKKTSSEKDKKEHTINGYTPGEPYRNELPITTLAVDRVTFPVYGAPVDFEIADRDIPLWQRWNDYGIGLAQGQGRIAAGGSGVLGGREARPLGRTIESHARLQHRRADRRGRRRPGAGRLVQHSPRLPAADVELAERRDQSPAGPA
jgi:hypothetical protein